MSGRGSGRLVKKGLVLRAVVRAAEADGGHTKVMSIFSLGMKSLRLDAASDALSL